MRKSKLTWKNRIAKAKKRKPQRFTVYDKRMAGNWPSCAVGEADKELAKKLEESAWITDIELSPNEDTIEDLGNDFDNYVMLDKVKEAERVYKEIKRLSKLRSKKSNK